MAYNDSHLRGVLLEILLGHVGPENRIRRVDLRARASLVLGAYVRDREMRRALEALRATQKGSLICSTCGTAGEENAGGYFMARNTNELDQYIRQDEHRAVVILKRLRKQRLAAGMELAGVSALPLEGL